MTSADIEAARFTDDMLSRIKAGFVDEAMGLIRRFGKRALEEHQKRAIVQAVLAEGGAETLKKMFKSGICGEQGGEFLRFMDNAGEKSVTFNLYQPVSEMLLAPMSIGVCTGNLNLTKAIAAHAVNISAWDDTFMPASCWAGWHHDCAHLDLLKECGFFINRVSSFNKNPLDYAVMRCARDIVRSLKADEISRFIKQEVKSAVMDLKHERAKGIFNVLGLNFNGKKETFEHICGLGASIDTFVYGITANTARASDIDSILKAVFFEAKARLAQAG